MRFLCFHGGGTNSQIFESQTATIRYELDQHYSFDFVEGNVDFPLAPEMKSFYDSSDHYFAYFLPTSQESIEYALANLSKFLDLEGPYDGVLAFSHGASFISTYILQQLLAHPTAPLPFKCAVFFSATSPIDPRVLHTYQEVKALRGPENDLQLINIPTAHIWDTEDSLSLGASQELWNLCEVDKRWRFLHGEGHEIPNSRDREAVFEITKVIRRAVEMGLSVE